MTERERDECRTLQDRWLALGVVQSQIRNFGEEEHITGQGGSPTFREVRTLVLPEWRQWFSDFFV